MKIVVILLSCLVAISSQQRFFLNTPFSPRIGYLPYFYGVLPNGQPFLFDSENESNQVAEEQVESDSLARSKFPHLQPQNKFLFANPFSIFSLFTSTSTTTATVVATATAWTTVNSTITTTSIQLCLPADQFAAPAAGANPLYSTLCARRRREVALLEDLKESIRSSEVTEVETSALPELPQERHVVEEPLLVSSKDDVEESLIPLRRAGRAATVLSTLTVTVTSTSTSYQFVATPFQKPIVLADAGALKCMPAGLVTCKA